MEPLLIPWLFNRKRQNSTELSRITLNKKFMLDKTKPQFRLISFCSRDSAETSRMIFAYAGIEYENFTFYNNYKALTSMEYDIQSHGFPILDWNGKIIYGNDAITRMLAKKYSLAGYGLFEEAQVDTIISINRDIFNSVINYLQGKYGWKDINLEKVYKEEFEPSVKKGFGLLEKKYASKRHENGFFFSSGVTYADFDVANIYETLSYVHPELMAQFPNVGFIKERVYAIPQLQTYLRSRLSIEEIMKWETKKKVHDLKNVEQLWMEPNDDKCTR